MNAKRDAVIASLEEEERMVELMQSEKQEASAKEAKTAQSLFAIHNLLSALVGQRKLIGRIRDLSEEKFDEQPLIAIFDKHSHFLRTIVAASYEVQAGLPIDLEKQLAIELVFHDFPKLSEDAVQARGHWNLIKSLPDEQRPPFIKASLKHIDEQLAELNASRQRIVEIQLELDKKEKDRKDEQKYHEELREREANEEPTEREQREEFIRNLKKNSSL
jgi:hypothetical protein